MERLHLLSDGLINLRSSHVICVRDFLFSALAARISVGREEAEEYTHQFPGQTVPPQPAAGSTASTRGSESEWRSSGVSRAGGLQCGAAGAVLLEGLTPNTSFCFLIMIAFSENCS